MVQSQGNIHCYHDIVSHICDCTERHSRTTIYTTKTVIIKKSYIEEQMVSNQWVTTDEYQVNSISYRCTYIRTYLVFTVYIM